MADQDVLAVDQLVCVEAVRSGGVTVPDDIYAAVVINRRRSEGRGRWLLHNELHVARSGRIATALIWIELYGAMGSGVTTNVAVGTRRGEIWLIHNL